MIIIKIAHTYILFPFLFFVITFILQWNINGLFAHLEKLKLLLSQKSPALICIQETNFTPNKIYHLKNYRCSYKNRIDGQIASGGVAIYSKEEYNCDDIPLNTPLEAVAVRVMIGTKKVSVINIYIPRSRDLNPIEIQSIVNQTPAPRIVLGDFNSYNPIWGSDDIDNRGRLMEGLLDTCNFYLLNTGEKTRFNSHTGEFSAIDLSMCDATVALNLSWEVLPYLYGSDHLPIYIESDLDYKNTDPRKETPRWNLKKANWNIYRTFIDNNLEKIDRTYHDLDKSVEEFTQLITEAAEKSMNKIIVPRHHNPVPWWNTECEHAIADSKKAFNKLKANNNQENLMNFKRLRARAKYVVKKSKKESWATFCSSINANTPMAAVWNKVKRIKAVNTTRKIRSLLVQNDQILTDPTEIAETLAESYETTSSDINYPQEFLQYKIEAESTDTILNNTTDLNHPLNIPITTEELTDALKTCKNTSPGHDNIPYALLQNLPPSAIQHLLEIYNHTYKNQQFPHTWLESTIIPILKPNKPKDSVLSYRPISLTCTMCKLLEKIINRRLIWFLEKNNILASEQCGFRRNRSTTDNIVSLESEIHKAFINKQKLIAISLDLEKAYDMTWRHKIITSLKNNNITGNILAFVRNFLSHRTFRVRVDKNTSERKVLQNGIPQGSVLSTTLFLVAINDILENIQHPVKASLFADDLLIYVKGKQLKSMESLLQTALGKIEHWAQFSGFKFSVAKTSCILFSRRKNLTPVNLKLYDRDLKFVNQIKFLGVIFDSKLNWKEHINYLKSSCTSGINLLRVLSHQTWGADIPTLLHIYRSLIRTKLDYGSIAYSTAKKSYLKIVDTIQNQALRIICGAFKSSPTESLHCLCNEAPLEFRRKILSLSYCSNISANTTNLSYSHIFPRGFIQIPNLNSTPPLHIRLNKLLSDLHYTISPNMLPLFSSNHPPWILSPANFNFDLIKFHKKETHPKIIKKVFSEICSGYQDCSFIYTDASRIQDFVGAAVVTPTSELKYRLPRETSIYTGELFAIYEALLYMLSNVSKSYVVCSDSLSALESFQNLYAANPLVQLIKQLIHEVHESGTIVNFIFVPSHVGIKGNEIADQTAKDAAISEELEVTSIYIHTDIKSHLKQLIIHQWQRSWQDSDTHLKQIKPSVVEHLLLPGTRKTQVILSRLRLGHTRLTHGHLMSGQDPPQCELCQCRLTVKHLICECRKFHQERSANRISANIKEALTLQIGSVMKFLAEISIFNLV